MEIVVQQKMKLPILFCVHWGNANDLPSTLGKLKVAKEMEDSLEESVSKENGHSAGLCANRKDGSNVDAQNDSGGVRVCQEFSSDSSEWRETAIIRKTVPRGPSVRVNWIIHWR